MSSLITEIEAFDLALTSFALIAVVINIILVIQARKLRLRVKDNYIKTNQILEHIRKHQSSRALLQTSIHEGASAVEDIHQSVSDTAFNVMEALSSSNKTKIRSRQLRIIHDHTKTGVYKSVKNVNKHVGVLTDSVLSGKKGKPTADK